MNGSEQRRRGADRRQHSRGGRRPEDQAGYAPLVFVVSRDPADRQFLEEFLMEMRFAVVPCDGPGPALEAFKALRPDVIVSAPRDVAMLRDRLPSGRQGAAIPIVEFGGASTSIEMVLSGIRQALRECQMAGA